MNMKQGIGNQELVQKIASHMIKSPQGAIPFQQYMSMCLYYPGLGYYANRRTKLGKQGDFYTSSSIGTIMGEMLARAMVKLMDELFAPIETGQVITLVEWGGGTGRLARDLLDELRSDFPIHYECIQYISLETSDVHQEEQKQSLEHHSGRVKWMSAEQWFAEGREEHTIVFSNELLDAFPVHRVAWRDHKLHELYVQWDQKNGFQEKWLPVTDGPLLEYMACEKMTLVEGQIAEINLEAEKWIRKIGSKLRRGALLTIDYGAAADEIYAGHRMAGTLMCYYKHQAHDNPYIHVGEQDITAHINFSACIRAGVESGFASWVLTDQKTFLLEAGVLDKLQTHQEPDPFHPIARKNRAIRQILLSDQMSELFKVLVQKK